MPYIWIPIALLACAFYGSANLLDNLLSRRKIKSPVSLIFYSGLFHLIFLPLVLIFARLAGLPVRAWILFGLLGVINVGYLFPYYRGLQNDETSVAISLLSMEKIFIPISAFFIVGERLAFRHYLGIAIIVICSAALGYRRSRKKIELSKTFWYITLSAFILSFEGVLFKYLFNLGISVPTAMAGQMLASFFFSLLTLVPDRTRRQIALDFHAFKNSFRLFAAEEGLTLIALLTENFAVSLAPVSLVKSISAFTPFFLLLYARILEKDHPTWFKEEIDFGSVIKKGVLFTLMVIGVLLVGF